MYAFLITIHVIVCFALIGIVLLQQGKGADMGATFGGSSQTLFGSSGATTFLGKITAAAAVVFMLTSLGLTYQSGRRYKASIVRDQAAAPAPQPAAQQPAPAPAPGPAAPEAPAADSPSGSE